MKSKRSNKRVAGRQPKKPSAARSQRERSRREIERVLDEIGVEYSGAHLGDKCDGGRRARVSTKSRRDEREAEGVFSSSRGGFGFVSVEGEERDIFIPEGKTLGAIDGDTVVIIYHSYKSFGEEKTEGRVKEIKSYGRRTVIGCVEYVRVLGYRGRKTLVLAPDDTRLAIAPEIVSGISVKPGEKIEARLIRKSSYKLECEAIRSFGEADSREANYEAILAECEIKVDFTPEEEAEAAFFASLPLSAEGRRDLRSDIIFTIDGEGAKDLDDAVSLKRLPGGGWLLGVHIADVSYYVRERTHLDRAVMARGTSVYFTDKVVPMLPTSLSNGACSLGADEDKYAISALIKLDSRGEIIDLTLAPSIIRSRVRGVYSEVNAILKNEADRDIRVKYKSVLPSIEKMHELYLVLRQKSEERGAVELDSPESEILLDEGGVPVDVFARERGEAERMIEQFMLTANEAVASYLYDRELPCVYRIHEAPPPDKLDAFLNFMHNLDFDTTYISRDKCESRDFAHLLKAALERGISLPVSYTMLRSMAKAVYSDKNSGHFGLGIKKYCHFTSPIRRLSDLATHRIIRRVLFEGKRPELFVSYARRAAAAASDAELRALSAERRIENLYKVIYMSDKIGEEFDAVISSVTSFGLFCMPENCCEGLIPISSLGYGFVFDEKTLTVRRGYERYRLGDKIRVRLEEADIVRGKLRYECLGITESN